MEIILGFGMAAVALVALNFGLQRLAHPDKGNERIAGCCGMALPEEMLRPEMGPETQTDSEALLNKQNEEYEEHHAL